MARSSACDCRLRAMRKPRRRRSRPTTLACRSRRNCRARLRLPPRYSARLREACGAPRHDCRFFPGCPQKAGDGARMLSLAQPLGRQHCSQGRDPCALRDGPVRRPAAVRAPGCPQPAKTTLHRVFLAFRKQRHDGIGGGPGPGNAPNVRPAAIRILLMQSTCAIAVALRRLMQSPASAPPRQQQHQRDARCQPNRSLKRHAHSSSSPYCSLADRSSRSGAWAAKEN